MPKLYILRGLPASGKTTYCRQNLSHAIRINRDSLRWMIYGSAWNPKRENEITLAEHGLAKEAITAGKDVVIDATNLNAKTLAFWEGFHSPREVIDLTDVSPWTCVENDRKRPQHEQVGADVIWDKYYKYLAPKPYRGHPDQPTVIISDLDGTVRDNSWRDAFDTTGKCIDDPPRWHVIHAIRGCQGSYDCPAKVVFFSGMEGTDANYSATTEWLKRYFANFDLHMRNVGDHSRDSAVKLDMFYDYIVEPALNVEAVFDDRPQVIRECWVKVGLYDRIFSVGMPHYEF